MKTTCGVIVDVEKIAAGLVSMMDRLEPCYAAAAAFGMLPAPLIDCMEKSLAEKFEALARSAAGYDSLSVEERRFYFGSEAGPIADQQKQREFIREVSHAVCLEMYRLIPMVV